MKHMLKTITKLLQQQESFVMATVVNTAGSAPRSAGAKMIVLADGSIMGTIGGGLLEANVMEQASEVMKCRQSRIAAFDLTGRNITDLNMICGGRGEVLIDFVDACDELTCAVYKEALHLLAHKSRGCLITALSTQDGSRFDKQHGLIGQDYSYIGQPDVVEPVLSKLASRYSSVSICAERSDNRLLLIEPLRHPDTVYIFGAGHVAQYIAPVSNMVGFHTVVFDDRMEFANHVRFPGPTEIRVLSDYNAIPVLAIDDNSYIVIVTRGHLYDKTVLEWALTTKAAYIGMIASRRKRDTIYEALQQQGFRQDELTRVHSPIGVSINAETPEEIAVSIVAELIQVRAGRTAGNL